MLRTMLRILESVIGSALHFTSGILYLQMPHPIGNFMLAEM